MAGISRHRYLRFNIQKTIHRRDADGIEICEDTGHIVNSLLVSYWNGCSLKLLQQITNLPVHSMLTLPVILFGHKSVCSKLLFEIMIIVGGKDFAGGSPFGINNILHCTQIIGRERSIGQCFLSRR